MADYFEAVAGAGADAKLAANWITATSPPTNSNGPLRTALPPEQLAEMVQLIDGGRSAARSPRVLPEPLEKGGLLKAIVDAERGLGMISDRRRSKPSSMSC